MSFPHLYCQKMLCAKLCSMIIWFWHQIVYFFSVVTRLMSLYFLTFSMVFREIIHQLKQNLFRIIFWFFSQFLWLMYDFNHVFWLQYFDYNSMFFLKLTHDLMLALNLWFEITYSVLSCKSATSFLTFSVFILSGKSGKLFWTSYKFSGYWIKNLRKYPSLLFSL